MRVANQKKLTPRHNIAIMHDTKVTRFNLVRSLCSDLREQTKGSNFHSIDKDSKDQLIGCFTHFYKCQNKSDVSESSWMFEYEMSKDF